MCDDVGIVSSCRHDGARLRTDRRNLALFIRFLRRQSSREENRYNVQAFFRTAVLTGDLRIILFNQYTITHAI